MYRRTYVHMYRRTYIGRPRGEQYISYKEYKTAKHIFAKALTKATRVYEQTKFDDANRQHDMDSRAFWKYVRRRIRHGR